MTDGQSEAAQYISTSSGDDFVFRCYRKLRYGLPLDVADQQRLWEIASGCKIPRRKRCAVCNSTGTVASYVKSWRGKRELTEVECLTCDGRGYVSK